MANYLCFGRASLLGDGTGCTAKLLGGNVSSSKDSAGDVPVKLETKETRHVSSCTLCASFHHDYPPTT